MSLVSLAQLPGGESQLVSYTIFPNGGMRALSATVHFTGSSILSYCVARRVKTIRVASVNDLKNLSWPRFCVVMILIISWMFIFATGILIHGVGLSSQNACTSGVFMCIWLYALTKVFIYAFLTEKVRVVWDVVTLPRLSSPVYIICLVVMVPFAAMPIMMTIGRIAIFRSDMTCIIGLRPFSSIALLSYDLFTNVFLNAMFLWPLLRSKLINYRLRVVARRTLVAAVAALATSITNVAVLTVLKHELGWVCLGSCTTDVTLNALVIFWLTMPTANCFTNEPATRPGNLHALQQSSHNKPDTEPTVHKPASTKSPMVILAPPTVHKSRASVNASIFNKSLGTSTSGQPGFAEAHDLQYTASLPEFPVSPTVASTSVGNVSMLAGPPGDDMNSARRSTALRSLGEFFGLSRHRPEQDVEVHVEVVTQHDVELGDLASGRAKQDDDDSLDQTKLASEWYR
ncbi:unnamed protein product [Rhizoctonia solani]|uniref:Transmembrane protein n=1 Tax=Rhizoctonia solani TaxID=456999 RepID=A0A8H2Y1C7_9AGAM|nr:unnamed protein product [Rhizoctonia solani]